MKALTLENAKEGMILAQDVITNKGQVLLKAGIELNENLLSLLTKYNVDIILVNIDDTPIPDMTPDERNFYLQQIRPEKKKLFKYSIDDPMMYELYEAVVQNTLWETWYEKQK